MPKREQRVLGVLLILSLIGTVTLLAGYINLVRNELPLPARGSGSTIPPTPDQGTLLVDVLLGVVPKYTSPNVPILFRPIPNERVDIVGEGSRSGHDVAAFTNATGIRRVYLASGNYTIGVNESRFQVSVSVHIESGMETQLTVRANRYSYVAGVEDLPDRDSSGWIVAQSFFVSVHSPRPIANSSERVFVETEMPALTSTSLSSSTAAISTQQFEVRFALQEIRNGSLFLQIIPSKEFKITGITTTRIIVYRPTYSVTTVLR